MNHRQRLEAVLSGKEIDRPPVALWRHFPIDDQDPGLLSSSILLFQRTYDFDFVKITPASSFCVLDHGVRDEWKGNPEGTRCYTQYPIIFPEDWRKLSPISPVEGYLGRQLECIRQIKQGLPSDTPFIQTIFDPMAQAKNLAGRENLLVHMRQHPEELSDGLEILMRSTIAFVKECIRIGVDGIFFAIQHAQASLLTREEVSRFITPFDEQVLGASASLWLNVEHLHGKDLYFDAVPKLGISVLNWHDRETSPSLAAAASSFNGAVCGGLRQWETLAYGNPEIVRKEAENAIKSSGTTRFILGTGCVLPIIAPHSNIMSARQAVENIGS